MKTFLIRHGQTTGDVEDRFGGDYNDHLSEEGRLQAETLAEKLASEGIEIIYCSPKIRALETAEILKQKLHCKTETIDDLRERNQYGVLTGMIKAEAKEKYPKLAELLKNYRNCLPDAESYESLKERVLIALNKLVSDYKTIAVVTHGGPIKAVIRKILGKEIEEIKIEDCGYAVLEKNGDSLRLEKTEGITIGDK